jgi:hypothetical protein
MFGILNFGHCDLPIDLAQGGESFDFAQDREPVERLVEPFVICVLLFVIWSFVNHYKSGPVRFYEDEQEDYIVIILFIVFVLVLGFSSN